MTQTSIGKFYVVFDGHRPGIYSSWVECEAQVTGFKRNFHKSYHSYEEAEEEWIKYCNNKGLPHSYGYSQLRSGIKIGSTSNYVVRTHTYITMEIMNGESVFVKEAEAQEFVLQYSMQRQLEEACNVLPVYTVHEAKVINGIEFSRYYASVSGVAIGRLVVLVGKYAKNDFDTREDVADLLLCRSLAVTGKKIKDCNHSNVEVLQSHVEKLTDEKFELELEIAKFNAEMKFMRHNG